MFTKTNTLSEKQIIDAVRKKRECNAKALSTVVSLLEQNNKQEDFLVKLKDINQSHYDDVVEERYILHFCGYPLCPNILRNIPQKKFEISTATNKVYDIVTRKKYCCTNCFKASEYIRSQILTSPLWIRNHESIPDFKLLNESK